MKARKPLTKEEEDIIDEAQNIYYKKYSEETYKKWDEWEKAHPEETYTRHINHHTTNK